MDGSVHNLEVCYDTSERVEDRVEYEGLQRAFWIAFRSRDTLNNRIQDFLYALARFAGGKEYVLRLAAQKIDDLVRNHVNHR